MPDNTETTPGRLAELYRERHKVRLDPTINYGHMLSAGASLLSAAAFVITGWVLMDKRVVVLEEARAYQQQRDLAQDNRVAEKFTDVQRSLDRIETNQGEMRRELKTSK